MDVRAGGGARHRATKSDERYPFIAKVNHESLPLRAVGVNRDIHRVPVIQVHAVMNDSLT